MPKIILLFSLLFFSSLGFATNSLFDGNTYQNSTWWRPGSTLDLDFGNNRYYLNGTTYSSIGSFITGAGATFTRSSTATYYDSTGTLQTAATNTPRLNYDPATRAPRGILIEETSTNQLKYSSDCSQSPWSHQSSLTFSTSPYAAPDGGIAKQVTADGSTLSYINQTGIASVASVTATRSIYAKAGTTSNVILEFTDSTNCNLHCVAIFNLSAKTAVWQSVKASQGLTTITAVGNGWYRLTATLTFSSAGAEAFNIYIDAYGAGVGSVSLWGAQLEFKSFPTSYIPTTTATVARSADNFSIPSSGWFNATTGTFLGWSYGQINSNQLGYARVVGGDYPIGFLGYNMTGTAVSKSWNGTSGISTTGTGFLYPNITQMVKMAFAWDQNAMTGSVGVSKGVVTGTTYTGSWSSTNIYPGGSNYDPLNAELMRMTFFPVRMTDAFLKGMTP